MFITLWNGSSRAIIPYINNDFTLDRIQISPEGRYLEFVFTNKPLLPMFEALQSMYSILLNNDQFKQFSNKKIIISHIGGLVSDLDGYDELIIINLHKNVIIDNYTSFHKYYSKIKSDIKPTYHSLYGFEIPNIFYVKVWKADHLMNKTILTKTKTVELRNKFNNIVNKFSFSRSFSTSARQLSDNSFKHLNHILPLKKEAVKCKPFFTMDIETVNVKGFQQPIIISLSDGEISNVFTIDKEVNDSTVDDLWLKLFECLYSSKYKKIIVFVHNLGGFDGIFLHKFVSKLFDNVEAIIDESSKYILIKVIFQDKIFIFKDSYRIFPVGLNDLCKVFNTEGKLESYNPEWNNVKVLEDVKLISSLKKYAKQDVVSLHNALTNSQIHFIEKYGVDITTVVSLPSLALKIFRLKFLSENIPILNSFNDSYVRKAYYGGAVDIYKAHAVNARYYDKNSLYPEGMCELMPLNVVQTIIEPDIDKFDIDNFFGFLEVDIECPDTILRPVLPFKHEGRTIFPQGIINGVYFSEEIKEVLKLGYKIIKIHSAKRFSSSYIFNDYVTEKYELKAKSVGAERWIAKLLLNSLYGIFGRKQESIKTITVDNSQIEGFLATHTIKNIIPIDENRTILLISDKVNNELLSDLNNELDVSDTKIKYPIKSNVAIAAAITAYARIKMIPYKLMPGTIYTDTDSIITTDILSDDCIGKDLGQMKDELSGNIIKEILILGCKQYGYYYFDENNVKHEKSVWAGVERNSLLFTEIFYMFKGGIINKIVNSRFFKSLTN